MTETVTRPSTPAAEPNTLVNALLGGVVSVVLGFVPFSPVLGGAVAGYLQGADTSRGVRVGIYAGLVAAVPLAFVLFLLVSMLSFVPVPGGFESGAMDGSAAAASGGSPLLAIGVLLVVFALAALYTVGLSALGGYLGSYVKGR